MLVFGAVAASCLLCASSCRSPAQSPPGVSGYPVAHHHDDATAPPSMVVHGADGGGGVVTGLMAGMVLSDVRRVHQLSSPEAATVAMEDGGFDGDY